MRPQVGVLVWPQALSPQTLAALVEAQADQATAARLREFLDTTTGDPVTPEPDPETTEPGAAEPGATAAGAVGQRPDGFQAGVFSPWWSYTGWADPPELSWVGTVPPVVAQRIACDAELYRIILDPATSMPLDVGRAHRLVPYWIRRALYMRDRGCRWHGCQAPPYWADAHHLIPWADGGETSIEDCILLCRFHHVLVHEGGWSIHLDHHTGEVHITRPGGIPYLLPRGSPTRA